jgi:lactonase
MSRSDRRTFLKHAGGGALVASFGCFALPANGLPGFAQAEAAKPVLPDPIPAREAALAQIKAEPWLKIDDGNVFLKGIAFDRDNNLLVMAAYPGKVDTSMAGRIDRSILRITPKKEVTAMIKQQGPRMCDHAIHKDGRIFIACLTGELLVANPDGSDIKPIASRWKGKPVELSDLTFDSKGNLYVTDFTGTPGNATGGVYRWASDFQSVEPFVPNLVTPNGIAFSSDEKSLWVSCSLAREVYRITMDEGRKSVQQAVSVYKLSGPGGDGIRLDVKGNVYLSMNFQGRFLVFNEQATPIADVLLPGRDRGELLSSANLAFKPGTDEVYAVASGPVGGTWIYKFRGLATGLPLFSHQ